MTKIPQHSRVRLPRPRPWSEPVSEEQLQAFAPEGLERDDVREAVEHRFGDLYP